MRYRLTDEDEVRDCPLEDLLSEYAAEEWAEWMRFEVSLEWVPSFSASRINL